MLYRNLACFVAPRLRVGALQKMPTQRRGVRLPDSPAGRCGSGKGGAQVPAGKACWKFGGGGRDVSIMRYKLYV
jgi:hypothetical protein